MIQQPLLSDVGICALVPDEWHGIWQPRHYVLTGLARYFHVVWMNPAPDWLSMLRAFANQSSHDDDTLRPPALVVHEPEFWLPKFYRSKWLADFTFDARLKRARRLLTSSGCRKIILYIWRPEFASAMTSIPFDLSCYHIDDDYSFSAVELAPDPRELALINEVGQVFIHSPGLIEKKGAINPNTAFVPNGVDFQAYASVILEPADLSFIPHPRIGYTGVIKKQLDWPLILDLTRRHRDWSFVFVGPRSPHPEIIPFIEELSRRDNVYLLERKSIREIPAYPQHFDACIMPYRVDAYTNNIYPLKLHEYLASGTPVVSSPIRSLQDFSSAIALAKSADEWSLALTYALEPVVNSPEAIAARQKIAREYDWGRLIYSVAQILCDRLGPEYAEQFEKLNIPNNGLCHPE